MHWLKFVAFNALGAALWVGTWVSIGYFAGQHISTIYNDVTRYSLYAAIAAVVLIAAWVTQKVRRHHRAKAEAQARAAAPAEDNPAGEAGVTAGEAGTAASGVTAAENQIPPNGAGPHQPVDVPGPAVKRDGGQPPEGPGTPGS